MSNSTQPETSQSIDKDALIHRRIIINTVSNYVARLLTLGLWFFLTPFLLRKLGASDYGLWILISSIVAYGALLDFGIAASITKYVAQYKAMGQMEQARSLIATTLLLYAGLGVIAVLLGFLVAVFIPNILHELQPAQWDTARWLTILSGLNLGIGLPSTTSFAVLRGLQRFELSNIVGIIGTILFAIATVGAVLLGGGVVGMVAVNFPVTILTQIPAIWLIRRIAPELNFSWRDAKRELLRTVASYSSALFIINIAGQIQTKTDEIVIGTFLPIANVTPYSIARRLSEIPQMLSDQFMKVLLPLASQFDAEDDTHRLQALYLTSSRLTLAIFIPLAVGLSVLVRPFLLAWVGAPYDQYDYLVILLTIASLLTTSQWPAGVILQGRGRHRILAFLSLGSALINLLLSLILVRPLGLLGVTLGTFIPTAIESLCFVMPYAMRVNQVSLRTVLAEIYWPTVAPAIPMALTLLGLRELTHPRSLISIALVGGLGLLVYIALYLIMARHHVEGKIAQRIWRNTQKLWRRQNTKV